MSLPLVESYVVAGRRRTLHRAVRTDTGRSSDERCNLDQARPRELYAELECARCFPTKEAHG